MAKEKAQKTPRPDNGTYWACVPRDQLGCQIQSRFLEYQDECLRRGLYSIWDQSTSVYYGYDPQTGSCSAWITEAGDDGEFLNLHVNEVHSLLTSQLNLITADRLVFEAIPANDSPQADTQASIGKQVLSYYQTDGKVENKLKTACKDMFLYGTSYIVQTWDATLGADAGVDFEPVYGDDGKPLSETVKIQEPVFDPISGETTIQESEVTRTVEQPRVRKSGDIVHKVYTPVDVAVDMGCRAPDEVPFYVVRERTNRWNLAARFPEHRQLILNRPTFDCDELSRREVRFNPQDVTTEEISVLRLFHDRTPALPEGMEAIVVGDTLLLDTPLAYKRIPVHVMVAEESADSPLGFSNTWNLLGPQSAFNAAAINAITTSDAGSIPKYAIARKSNVDRQTLSTHMDVLFYDAQTDLPDAGVPKLMQVPQMTGTHMQQMDFWRASMERQSGVNAVIRGESAGKSGADNALISAQAQQYMNGYSRTYQDVARSVALGIIEILQQYADDQRMIAIVGEDEGSYLRWFRGEDLSEIRQVKVEMGDPMTTTPQGKAAMAQQLLESFPGKITPEQYLGFIATGRLEPLYKAEANEIKLIRAENAQLAKGKPQAAVVSDNHQTHIQEHLAVLNSPRVRANQAVTTAVLAHVAEHGRLWRSADSIILAATGQVPPPPALAPAPGAPGGPGPAPAPSGAPQGGPAPSGGPAPETQKANVPGAPDAVAGVGLPNLPKPPPGS